MVLESPLARGEEAGEPAKGRSPLTQGARPVVWKIGRRCGPRIGMMGPRAEGAFW